MARRHDVGDADDAKSAYSCASSVGDDPEAALAALADVADLLEAKLGMMKKRSPTWTRSTASLGRARAAISAAGGENAIGVHAGSSTSSAMIECACVPGKVAGELEALRVENRDLRRNVARVEEVAARVTARVTARAESGQRIAYLQAQLDSAKKTIGRLVQERNATRRAGGPSNCTTPVRSLLRGGGEGVAAAAGSSAAPVSREVSNTDSETIRKVLNWQRTYGVDEGKGGLAEGEGEAGEASVRRRARSVVAALDEEPLVLAGSGWEDREEAAVFADGSGWGGREEAPAYAARNPGVVDGGAESLPIDGARTTATDRGRSAGRSSAPDSDAIALSLNGIRAEVGSVQSVGAGGSFRESAANSVAGDEIHVMPMLNIFQSHVEPSHAVGGLLGLLG